MADVELLPLPEWSEVLMHEGKPMRGYTADQMRAYARANLAPLQAENERLRAEVDEWKRRSDAYFQTAERQGKRAERLAEALRDARDCAVSHLGLLIADNMSDGVEQTKALIAKIDVDLGKEDRNG